VESSDGRKFTVTDYLPVS